MILLSNFGNLERRSYDRLCSKISFTREWREIKSPKKIFQT